MQVFAGIEKRVRQHESSGTASVTRNLYVLTQYAGMVELADTQDLGSCAERCTGSTPATRTKIAVSTFVSGLLFFYLLEIEM